MALSTIGDALDLRDSMHEPLRGPFFRSILLHLLCVGALLAYGFAHNFFHGSQWGSNDFQQGAIQATLVNTSALPLPQDHPPTENVLATENPSEAPDIEKQQAAPVPLPEALPVPVKTKPEKKPAQRRVEKKPPPQPKPKEQHKAVYGEASPANLPRAAANNPNAASSVAQTGGDFGSRFGWYVDIIKRKVAQNWYLQEVQPGTAAGATVYVRFAIKRDGSPTDVQIAASSGVPSLDSSCMRAIQRVDTFGSLPSGYNKGTLDVLYHCTFPGRQ